jgi:hypothetical protein
MRTVESTTRVCLLSMLIRRSELGKFEIEKDEKERKYSRADRRLSAAYDVSSQFTAMLSLMVL